MSVSKGLILYFVNYLVKLSGHTNKSFFFQYFRCHNHWQQDICVEWTWWRELVLLQHWSVWHRDKQVVRAPYPDSSVREVQIYMCCHGHQTSVTQNWFDCTYVHAKKLSFLLNYVLCQLFVVNWHILQASILV